VTDLVVRDHLTESAIEGHACFDIERRLQMHRIDCHCAPIHESVAAVDRRRSPVGMDLDAQIRTNTHGLRNALVLPVTPLIVGAALYQFIVRAVLVEHIGVVEDEAAEREDERHRHRRGARGPAGEAEPRHVYPTPKSGLPATHPKQCPRHPQQQRPRRPIELEHEPRTNGPAEAAHVREGPRRAGAIHEQLVLDADHGGEDDEEIHHQCDQHRHMLLVHQRVHQEDEHGKQQVLRELEPEKDLEVQADLEVVVAHERLGEHASRGEAHHESGEYQAESEKLAEEEDPFRNRRSVDVLAEPRIAFPPDQLAGEVHDEERYDHPVVSEIRQGGGNVLRQDVPRPGKHLNAPHPRFHVQHQHDKHRKDCQQEEPGRALRDHPERRPRD
jgi:hypothetical protein